jgi:hypothetical protein
MQTEQALHLLGHDLAPLALFNKHPVAMGEVIEVFGIAYTLERRTMHDLRVAPGVFSGGLGFTHCESAENSLRPSIRPESNSSV